MYNKLFQSILDSTIWLEPDPTRIVWLTLLASMDQDGYARFGSIDALAWRAHENADDTKKAVATLEAPEASSAHEGDDGRRIERVPGGWLVLNAAKYREIVRAEESRARNRERVEKHRQNRRNTNPCNGGVMGGNDSVMQSDTDAGASAEEPTAASRPDPLAEFRASYPKRQGTQPWARALRAWNARRREGHEAAAMVAGAQRYALWVAATGKAGTELVMQASTFLGPDKPFLEPWEPPSAANGAGASEAWLQVVEHVRRGLWRKGGLNPAIDAAVKEIGGYQEIAMGNTNQLPFLKRQFATAYKP
jgi:hypothetical protein